MSTIKIPLDSLDIDTLNNIIEDYVTREGTDNGSEVSLSQNVSQVLSQLKAGTAVIVFDDESSTIHICQNIPDLSIF